MTRLVRVWIGRAEWWWRRRVGGWFSETDVVVSDLMEGKLDSLDS